MEAQIQRFYEDLKNGNSAPLKVLADSAGYNDNFNIMFTKILSRTDDEKLKFWRSTGHEMAYASAPSPGHRAIVARYMDENSPRVHWNKNYKNLFTKVKEDERTRKFIDCWECKDSNRIALATGKFPQEGEKDYYDDCDEETNKVLHLSTIRSKYPPLVPWKEIVGIPDCGPAPFYFLLKRCIDLAVGVTTYTITENLYMSLGAIVLAEYGLLKSQEHKEGKIAFRKLGVELDKSAIDKLVLEASS